MFAILVTALLAGAALAAVQVARARSAVEFSGVALLAVGDRLQDVLAQANSTGPGDVKDRILAGPEHRRCDSLGVCTQVHVADAPDEALEVRVVATVPDGARAERTALLVRLPTSGAVTGVDARGRPVFAEDGGAGADMWVLVPAGAS